MLIITHISRLLALAALITFIPAGVGNASQKAAGPSAVSVPAINVSFKLDPRITRGMYMGERWVSPPTYTAAQTGKEITVDARVDGLDAAGKLAGASPAWRAEDPDMVRVSPAHGRQVRITVRRSGESVLSVTCGKATRKLTVKATTRDNVTQVEISQQ